MMFRFVAIVLATLLVATLQMSAANAGCPYRGYQPDAIADIELGPKSEKPLKKASLGKDGPENELTIASREQTCIRFVAETGAAIPYECA
ncbi:MAG: hypothetical protein JNN24_17275 [Hyphomicrobium zavarzinii]|jgi:hypothetical protein|uniref:hypothetical protein n=1 Tax=Hyphomicrobium TaxID=81 RepID=UPI000362E66C|nr:MULTISPECIES: hypothetical protein [Hyphomicrobium]MBL8847518.1 hypothetical protein [Hyphomicrobium zavarzinii]WBT36249.1 hypothetical protein PE058_11285 [Hyphomicrobium sp. DMF-1]HML44877.1 hypothetical protein [Hyphomicrobium zavarzinii]